MRGQVRNFLYSLLTALLTPVVLVRLLLRGLKSPAYLKRWLERFGVFKNPHFSKKSIWIHAVSVGEVNAAIPLIKELMRQYQSHEFVITTITPTGSDRVRQVFGEQVFHVYLPYDLPGAVKRFLKRTNPDLAVIMETEIWPNLFRFCKRKKIPIVVANARLSEISMKGYRWVESLVAKAFNHTTYVAAQTLFDAQRMIALGCNENKIYVIGSLKFDIAIDDEIKQKARQIRANYPSNRLIWIAASTHLEDDIEILNAYEVLKQKYPQLLLVIIPRHPERFQSTTQACRDKGFVTQLKSHTKLNQIKDDVDVFMVDTMGEMLEFYAASDIAFVGGSISDIGGHNVLEAAVFSLPILVGPNTHNFAEIVQLLEDCGGSFTVRHSTDIINRMQELIDNPELRRQMGSRAEALLVKHRGAVTLTMQMIDSIMSEGPLPEGVLNRCYLIKSNAREV